MKTRKSTLTTLAVACGILVATATVPAMALTCTPTNVVFTASNGGEVSILCDGNWYIGSNQCTINGDLTGIDVVKSWLSMVQAAILSGKNIEVATGTCNGVTRISWLQLDK